MRDNDSIILESLYQRILVEKDESLEKLAKEYLGASQMNKKGYLAYSDRSVLNYARKLALQAIKDGVDKDDLIKRFGLEDHTYHLSRGFYNVLDKLKKEKNEGNMKDWWDLFQPLMKVLENSLREQITEKMRDIQKEVKDLDIKKWVEENSDDGKLYKEIQKLYDNLWKMKKPIVFDGVEYQPENKRALERELSDARSALYKKIQEHPFMWVRKYVENCKEPEYSKAIEKVIADQIELNKNKLKASVSKTLGSLDLKDVKEKSVRIGAKGFEGQFEITLADDSKKILDTKAIGAGGYNIQSFHYRYLNRLKHKN